MTHHYLRQLDKLKSMALALSELVGRNVEDAIASIESHDSSLAAKVIARETQVDLQEVDLEEECLHTLALYQPVASDLRFIVCLVTINKDLERIGDLAVDLAEQTLHLAASPTADGVPFDLVGEARRVRQMLHKAVRALVTLDAGLAEQVRAADDEVDCIHQQACRRLEAALMDSPDDAGQLLALWEITRRLERIADHAVNIAEDVIYVTRGEFLRHRSAGSTGRPLASPPGEIARP